MENMQEKYDAAAKALKDAQADLKRVKAGKEPESGKKRSVDACVPHASQWSCALHDVTCALGAFTYNLHKCAGF